MRKTLGRSETQGWLSPVVCASLRKWFVKQWWHCPPLIPPAASDISNPRLIFYASEWEFCVGRAEFTSAVPHGPVRKTLVKKIFCFVLFFFSKKVTQCLQLQSSSGGCITSRLFLRHWHVYQLWQRQLDMYSLCSLGATREMLLTPFPGVYTWVCLSVDRFCQHDSVTTVRETVTKLQR